MLKVTKLTKFYGTQRGIENLSFELKPSEILGVIGVNGSGKTTTFRLLLRLLLPDSGSITINKVPLKETDKTLFGYLPEERSLYRDLKVHEQLRFLGQLKEMDDKLIEQRTEYWLNRLGIPDYYDKKIRELSKGNQQKIQLISALLHDPQIVILDEPLTGLDVINAALFKEIIDELSHQKKIVLLSSHQFEHVEEFFEKILLLREGKAVWYGKVSELKKSLPVRYIRIVSETKRDYYMEDGVVHQQQSGQAIRLLMENETKAKKLFRKLLKEEPLTSFTIELPSLQDIIKERSLL